MGDDIGFHDAVAGIMRFGQCVRVRRNVGPEILNLGPLTIDHFLVIVDECLALPMRGAPQLATGICWRFEASEKAIGLRVRLPPDRDEPAQVSPDDANGMALGHQRGPAASQRHVCYAATARALAEVQRDWLVKLRNKDGLVKAVNLAGAFILSSQGKP
jgi:hypothetical protein